MKMSPAILRALLELPKVRAAVDHAAFQARVELQAIRLEDWQRKTGRKHPASAA